MFILTGIVIFVVFLPSCVPQNAHSPPDEAALNPPATVSSYPADEGMRVIMDDHDIAGYESYKADLESALRNGNAAHTRFDPDEPLLICTYRAVPCNMTGNAEDRFLVFWLAQPENQDHSGKIEYDSFYMYGLVSQGKLTVVQEDTVLANSAPGYLALSPVDFDGDGLDEILFVCPTGGSGGTYSLSLFDVKNGLLREHRISAWNYNISSFEDKTGFHVDFACDFSVEEAGGVVELHITSYIWGEHHLDSLGYGYEVFVFHSMEEGFVLTKRMFEETRD